MTSLRRMHMAGLIFALAACFATQAPAVEPKYLPSDTELLLAVNLKQMLNSEIAKQYKGLIEQGRRALEAQIQNDPGAKFLEKTGFDFLRDLHAVTLSTNGGKDLEKVYVVIEGKFDAAKIQAVAEEVAAQNAEVLKISKIGTTRVYEITPPGKKQAFAALVGDSMLIISPTQAALKDAVAGNAGNGMKAGFKSLLKTVTNKQSLSFAATGSAIATLIENAPVPNADALAGTLQGIDGISAAITLAKDIQFQLAVNAKDEETAKKTVALGNFGLLTIRTLAAQEAKKNEQLQPLVEVSKTLRITSEGNNVVLRGEVSLENLEKLIKVLPEKLNR